MTYNGADKVNTHRYKQKVIKIVETLFVLVSLNAPHSSIQLILGLEVN